MRRRKLIALLAAAAVFWPFTGRAQEQMILARIGFLGLAPAAASASRVEALRAGLRDLGWIEGKNILIDFRWAERVDQLPELATGLVGMKVDLIFAPS
jgi:putative tryptophan/tyrosine transport system substrate-binding protein